MKTPPFSRRFQAFSLVEVIVTVAVLGILAAIACQFAIGLRDRARQVKLESDVQALNTAVKIYLANGGSLAGITNAAEVVSKLKTVRNRDLAGRYAGYRGTTLDARVSPVFQTDEEAATGLVRAAWNEARLAFEIRDSGAGGISHFALESSMGSQNFGEEERAPGAVDYNPENGWIWSYRDAAGAGRAAPTVVQLAANGPAALPAPGAAAQRLAVPEFATPPGTYDYPGFPELVSITNPNPEGSSTVYVATAWDGTGIQWAPYTGPIAVVPGMQVLTCARHATPAYEDSFTVGGVYVRSDYSLQAPEIVTSAPYLNLESNDAVRIELVDRNPGFALRRLELSINGGGFTAYTGSLSVSPVAYASGLELVARAVPAGEGFRASGETAKALGVKLRKPVIEIGAAIVNGQTSIIPFTLANPNPEGSSVLLYALRNESTGALSSFQEYRNQVPVSQADYPKGFTVVAYANAASGSYLASDEASSLGLTFFGIPVTRSTIFVLDRSGSMAWEDGIGQVKAEMNRVLDQLKTEDRFAVIQFSTDANVLVNWTAATSAKVRTAKTKVNSLAANGLTNYEAALTQALGIARNGEVKQVVFLSDGAPTTGNTNPDSILALVNQLVARGVRVDTLPFGLITPDGRALLERMDLAGDLSR